MAGNKAGGQKAKETIRKKAEAEGLTYSEYMARNGRKGGQATVPKGFAKNKKLASKAGKKGGKRSGERNLKSHNTDGMEYEHVN